MMMKKLAIIVALVLASVALTSCGNEADVPQNCDIYLLIGQSNMAGRAELTEADNEPLEGVWLLNGEDVPEPAHAPMNRYSTIRKRIGMQGYNLGNTFAEVVGAKSENPVLIVCNARGGSSLNMWLKDAKDLTFSKKDGDDEHLWGQPMPRPFDEAVRRCKEAMKYGTLKAIIWHQGGSDSSEKAVKVYLPKLQIFVNDLREALGVGAEVPFIAGELYHGHRNSLTFNPMICHIGDYVEEGYWVSAEGCTVKSDNLHFDRAGLNLLGERYAAKLFEVLGIE